MPSHEAPSSRLKQAIELLEGEGYEVIPACPNCHHLNHAHKCWDLECSCHNQGVEYT